MAAARAAAAPSGTGGRVMVVSEGRLGGAGIAPAPTGQISIETLAAEMLTAVLVEEGVLTRETEYASLQEHRTTGRPVAEIICDSGYMAESELMSVLSRRCKVPHLSLEHYQIKPQVLESVPPEFARANHIMPLDRLGKTLNVATSNPLDVPTFKRLEDKTGLKVKPVLATPRELRECIDKYFPAPKIAPQEEPEATDESFRVTAKDLFKNSLFGSLEKEEGPEEEAAPGPDAGEVAAPSDDSRPVPLSDDEASAFMKTSDSDLFRAWAASLGVVDEGGGPPALPLPALPLADAEFGMLAGEEPRPVAPRAGAEPAAGTGKKRAVGKKGRKKARKKRKKKSSR